MRARTDATEAVPQVLVKERARDLSWEQSLSSRDRGVSLPFVLSIGTASLPNMLFCTENLSDARSSCLADSSDPVFWSSWYLAPGQDVTLSKQTCAVISQHGLPVRRLVDAKVAAWYNA